MHGMTEIPWYHDDYISDYYEDKYSREPEGMKADIEGIFKAWEFDSDAFGGECWACFEEFLGADGTPVGVFGGDYKWNPIPMRPRIIEFKTNVTDDNKKLHVTLKADVPSKL